MYSPVQQLQSVSGTKLIIGAVRSTTEHHRPTPALLQVPQDMPCIIMAHEFLDALPVHLFKLDDSRGWLEVLVDESSEAHDPHVRHP